VAKLDSKFEQQTYECIALVPAFNICIVKLFGCSDVEQERQQGPAHFHQFGRHTVTSVKKDR